MDQLAGFLLGILGSLLIWWLFTHWLVPVVEFNEQILVRPRKSDPTEARYLVKLTNRGKRDLIDVSVSAIVSIQTKQGSEKSWANCRVAFHQTGDLEHHIPLIPPGANRLITLHASHSEQICYEGNFTETVRQAARDKKLDLAMLMQDGAERGLGVRLRVYVFGFDSFSGARKLFYSKFYDAGDLQPFGAPEARSTG